MLEEIGSSFLLLNLYLFENNQGNTHEVKRNINMYSHYQDLFTNRSVYTLLNLLNHIKKNYFSDILSLFFFSQPNHPFDTLKDEFSYQHPVTGKEQVTSIYQLEHKAVSGCTKIFVQWGNAREKNNLQEFLGILYGPHLDTGLFDNLQTMQFFNLVALTKL